LYQTALTGPALYRPGGGTPMAPCRHPANQQSGYVMFLGRSWSWSDGSGMIRSIEPRHALRAIRTHWGLSQSDLGDRLGVTYVSIGRWERGEQTVPPWLPAALAGMSSSMAD
jgi:DNA-binding XRE family transcriptional regulator